ncbi:hypothetical protein V8F33_010194 [Rhypophila sp. PSN 637]
MQLEVRRSARTRTIRRPYDLGLTSPEAELSQAEVRNTSERDQDAAMEKRSRPIDDESHHMRKKSKVARNSVVSAVSARRQDQEFIDYDEVFGNGNAKIKYNIVEFPKESGKWYILRCLEHNMHFFRGALQAGAKHLNSGFHNGPRKQDRAFEMFHVQVLNCDAAKAEENNLAVKEAAESGYRYPRATKKARRAQRHRPPPTIIANSRHSPEVQPTIDPTVGEVYKISWLHQPALAVVLPIANLSLIGMTGPTVADLKLKIPTCYRLHRGQGTYMWDHHYKDGNSRVKHRKYPILAFTRGVEIPKFPEPFALPLGVECYDFLKLSELTMVSMDDPGVRDIEGYKAAKAFHERIKAWRASTCDRNNTEIQAKEQDEPGTERGNTDHQDGRDDGDQWNDGHDGDDDEDDLADSDDESADFDSDSADSDSVFGTVRKDRTGHDGNGPLSRPGVGLIPTPAQPGPSKRLSHHARESSLARVGSKYRVPFEPGIEPPAKTDFPLLETNSLVEGVEAPEDMDAYINEIFDPRRLGVELERAGFEPAAHASYAGVESQNLDEGDRMIIDGLPRVYRQDYNEEENTNAHSTISSSSSQHPSSLIEIVQYSGRGTRQFSPGNSGNTKGTTFAKPGRAVADMGGGVDKSGMPMRTIARAHSRLPAAGEGVMVDEGESGSSCERRRSTTST